MDAGTGELRELDAIGLLPHRIDLQVFTPAIHETGTWQNLVVAATHLNNGLRWNGGSRAQNDEVGWDLAMQRGTWRLDGIFHKFASACIVTVLVDNVAKGTIDLYSAAAVDNFAGVVAGIYIPSSKKVKVSLKAATKNASSTGFDLAFSAITLTKYA